MIRNIRLFALLFAFGVGMAALAVPLLAPISTESLLLVELLIGLTANVVFIRWFRPLTASAIATLISYDLLICSILGVMAMATIYPLPTDITDGLISAVGVLAVAYPLTQAYFIRANWSSGQG